MTQSVPVKDEAAAARRAVMAEKIRADQPARFSVAMVAPAASHVSGQIFGASGENIILDSQPRPIETVTKEEGWTVDTILSEAVPAMAPKFFDLNRAVMPAPSPPRPADRLKASACSGSQPVQALPFFPGQLPVERPPRRAVRLDALHLAHGPEAGRPRWPALSAHCPGPPSGR